MTARRVRGGGGRHGERTSVRSAPGGGRQQGERTSVRGGGGQHRERAAHAAATLPEGRR